MKVLEAVLAIACALAFTVQPADAKEMTFPQGRQALKKLTDAQADKTAKPVSISRILANERSYTGKLVKVSGTVIFKQVFEKGTDMAQLYWPGQTVTTFTLAGAQPFELVDVYVIGDRDDVQEQSTLEATGYVLYTKQDRNSEGYTWTAIVLAKKVR